MSTLNKHKTYSSALTSSKIVRRQVLDQILELVQQDEARARNAAIDWTEVGSIERQHDYLCRVLAELKKPHKS